MDEFVDQLLVGESVCEIQLPRLTQRKVLEETEGLAPRRSKLGKALGVMHVEGADGSDVEGGGGDDSAEEEGAGGGRRRYLSRSPSASPSPSPSGDERADRKEGSPEYWTEASDQDEEEQDSRRRRRRKRPVVVERGEGEGSDDDDEDAGRYISRSPSPAGSDGRFVSRSPTRSPEPERIQVEHIEGDV